MRLPIRELGRVGMISDLPPADLPPNAVTNAVNVAFRDGAMQRAEGLARAHDIVGDAVWMESWFSTGNGRSLVVTEVAGAPDASKIYEIIGGVVSDISPVSPISTGYFWDSCVFGTTAILNNGAETPWARTITDAGVITAMADWPAGWVADMIRPYRNFLVALSVTEGANPKDDTRVAWSNAAPNNGLPPDWDGLDPASLAGGTSLPGSSGPIMDAAVLGQSLIIYMQTAAHSMSLAGGQYVMSFRQLFDRGLLGRRCVVPFDSQHFCIGNGAIYTHNGSQIQYPADERIQTRFFSELARTDSIRLSNDSSRRLIEIAYSTDPDSALPNKVLVWNYQYRTWRFEDYDTLRLIRGLFVPDSVRLLAWDDTTTETWNDFDVSWQGLDVSAGGLSYQVLVQDGSASGVMRREPILLRDGVAFESVAEREYIDFTALIQGVPEIMEQVFHIKRIVPRTTGQGTVYFQFGTAETVAQGTQWGPIVPFNIEQDLKVDFRATGRYFAWRVYNDPAVPASFRLSGFDVDVEPAGVR